MAKKITSYEKAMQELEQIVAAMQTGTIGIDQLTEKVDRAAVLMNYCKTKLRDTEATIEQVLGKDKEQVDSETESDKLYF